MSSEIHFSTKAEAKAAGSRYYFTGKPCKRGHICERLVSSGGCVQCTRNCTSKWRGENRERNYRYYQEYYKENRENCLGYMRRYSRRHYAENKGYHNARFAKRRLAKLNRTLPGYEKEIEGIYDTSEKLSTFSGEYHVDHVIPLQGELVSGLHVPWNLEVITWEENLAKGNKFTPYIEVYGPNGEVEYKESLSCM